MSKINYRLPEPIIYSGWAHVCAIGIVESTKALRLVDDEGGVIDFISPGTEAYIPWHNSFMMARMLFEDDVAAHMREHDLPEPSQHRYEAEF